MKLILIEDEPESLMGMQKAIETIGMEFTLFTSNHAEKALNIIQDERPELIVTDIMLPYMTGLDLVEQVTRDDYKPQVIVVIGYNDFEYARRSIQVGVRKISVPFSIGQMNGYHNNNEPNELFWRLYSLYIAMCIFSSVVWILKVKPDELNQMLDKVDRSDNSSYNHR